MSSLFLTRSAKLTASTLRSYKPTTATAITSRYSNYNLNTIRGFNSTAAKMVVHNVEDRSTFTSTINDNKVVVLDCFATWCGPCKVIAPQVVKFSDEFPDIKFIKVDVDEVPDVAQELGIRAMPTFIIFKNGEKDKEVVGANPVALRAAIEAAAAPEPAAA